MSLSPLHPALSWSSHPTRELVRLAWPIVVSMVSYSVMTLADTLFVARLGAAAVAGVGVGGTAAFALVIFGAGLLRAVKVLVSQARGANAFALEAAYRGAGMWMGAAFGVAALVAGVFTADLLPLFTKSAEAGESARSYLAIRALGSPLFLVYVALREACYGSGDSRAPMIASVSANVLNVALDALFILVLGLGVAGAALATVAGHALEMGVLLALARRSGLGLGKARLAHLGALFRLGVPTGLQFVLEMGSFALLTAMLARLPEVELAAHQIALQMIHFSFLPAFAVAEAVSVLVGQAVGARKLSLVRRVAHRGLFVVGAYAALCTLALALLSREIAEAFTADKLLQHTLVQLLYVAALFLIVDAANIVARGALRGAGDVRVPAALAIACSWIVLPPLTWLLGIELRLGALGGWIAICVEIFAGASLFWWRFERGGWLFAARRGQRAAAAR